VEIKCQLDGTEVFIADLIACSTYFGHHYAHHQELKSSILQAGHITLSSTPDRQLENHSIKYHRQQQLYNTLELLMMGIMQHPAKPDTQPTVLRQTDNLKTTARNITGSNHCIILLSS